jgi:hypothetical protein
MRTFLRALACGALLLATTVAAPAQTAPPSPSPEPLLVPVRALVTAFNTAAAYPADVFTADAVVTDEFPPFVWNATNGGAKQWWSDLVADPGTARHAQFVAAKQHVEIGTPEFVRMSGTGGWFIAPSELRYTVGDETHVQKGRWLFYLRRDGDAWKISAHAWDELSDVVA